jgi:hypothetical protein
LIKLTTIFCALLVALLLMAAGVKVAIDSRAHFAQGRSLERRALRDGSSRDLSAAAEAYARAVASYVPFASHGGPALDRMEACAEALEERGEVTAARRIRARRAEAAAAVSLLYAPYPDRVVRAPAALGTGS